MPLHEGRAPGQHSVSAPEGKPEDEETGLAVIDLARNHCSSRKPGRGPALPPPPASQPGRCAHPRPGLSGLFTSAAVPPAQKASSSGRPPGITQSPVSVQHFVLSSDPALPTRCWVTRLPMSSSN